MSKYKLFMFVSVILAIAVLCLGIEGTYCQTSAQENESLEEQLKARVEANRAANSRRITNAQRKEAAKRAAELRQSVENRLDSPAGNNKTMIPMEMGMGDMPMPGDTPHYFGPEPNWAYSPAPRNVVIEWNIIAQDLVQPAPMPGMMMSSISMSEAFIYLSYVQGAVYDALVAIEGGFQPYNSLPAADPDASRDAAVAAAAYNVLVHYFPMDPQKSMLDQEYAASLATISDGPDKLAGITVGEQAASAMIALRADDGLGEPSTYVLPPPGPGVWEPTATMPDGSPAPPIDPWMVNVQPFLINSASQFRPGPPPDLASPEWATQMNEVKNIGAVNSATRTAAQTEVAQFWTTNMVIMYNEAFRDTATNNQMNLIETARLLAMGNMVGTDTLIAGFDTKYYYSFWRPVTAIRRADTDGNPATDPSPMWMPLIMTPNHPEYIAGHSNFASAEAEVFANYLGTTQIEIDLSSTATGTTRHYATVDVLKQEVTNARVWGGIHYRGSCVAGETMGQQVAQFALQQFFWPAPSRATHVANSGGIRKFIDSLPRLGYANRNNLEQYIPIANPDTITYPESDYYEIGLVQYSEQMHTDLPPTLLRGYVQLNNGTVPGTEENTIAPAPVHYLGPLIIAQKDRPVRVKFVNMLPIGEDGNLFIPVDTTVMGAGMAPDGSMYSENRATLHLHGGKSPWISDGTPHQWTVPAGETTSYPKGVSASDVPDMVPTGDGELTFYWTNQQSSRLMFYHDHAYGITRLNVYVGEAAAYLITDDIEQALIDFGIIPAEQIPLVIQDKTFVDANTITTTDPLWRWGSTPGMPNTGDLWMPHVYVPAQNPYDIEGVNPFGRWHYGPWFWPPTEVTYGPVENPYYDPINAPWEPPFNPGVPHPSMGMESFMDAPLVNGTVYPYLVVQPKAYRFRILNAANDRFWNLQLYEADPTVTTSDGRTNTEVKMVSAAPTAGFPETWPADGREGGVPDPATAGPSFIQIGSESGFLPYPAVIPNQPIAWNTDPTTFNFGNVSDHALLIAPAERADVIIDFSEYAGKTLILYNDAPAAFPALDARYDYYTGAPDMTDVGGTVGAIPGFGPNTRTIMQIRVEGDASEPFDLATLESMFVSTDTSQGVFAAAQDPIIVGQTAYDSAYNTTFPTTWPTWGYVNIQDNFISFQTVEGDTVTLPLGAKAIQDEMGEAFDHDYGRMSGFLGLELPRTMAGNQNFMLYPYNSPPVEVLAPSIAGTPIGSLGDGTQIWKITHNGVDTHPVHFHLYDVQLINRVGWDGAIRLPDANELGWKDTVRVSPLEDTIVALRPILPTLPFEIPNSVRLLDPTMPEGAVLVNSTQADITGTGFMGFAPNGEPVDIINHYVNFGWEYVIHCHILSHEEMDMMHSVAVAVAPRAPSDLDALANGDGITLTWTDNSINETQFTIQRADDSEFTTGLTTFVAGMDATSYTDDTVLESQLYYYRVWADNVVGDTTDYTDPAINEGATFPTKTASSDFSNTVSRGIGPVVAPGAPRNVTAIGGNAQATVSFSLPTSNGGSAITSYIVISNPGGITGTGVASPIIVTGLINGTTYTFTVAAINEVGTGPASAPSNSVILATAPGAPTNVTAVGGNAQATVNFSAPASDGGNSIISYTVISNPGNMTATGAASPITVTGLANGASYTFTVTATNAVGTGPASALSNSIKTWMVPGAPTNVSAIVTGNGQARVSFAPPASNGGSPITSYTVTSNPDNKTATGIASPITVTGLNNSKTYTFTVAATNAIGTGPNSTASNSISFDRTAPKVTASVSPSLTVRSNNKTITVKVKGKVSDSSSGVNRASGTYSVSVSSGSSVPGGTFKISKNGNYSFKVKLSISSSRTYTIKVQAQDNAGNAGKASAKFKVLTSLR